MSVHNLNEVSTESRHLRTVSAGECQPRYNDGVATIEGSNGRILMRKPVREHYSNNGMVLPRPNSEYISPAGISALDIRTRLRITEAELAIVQREVADLKAERSELEASSRQYEESWRFSVSLCGQIVEEKYELLKKYEQLDQTIKASRQHTPEMKSKKLSRSSKSNVDNLKLNLDTQVRVAEVLEQERDRAFDDFEMAQAQLYTLVQQYQELASSCSEVARERNRLKTDVQLLREELQRYEPESDVSSSRTSLKKMDSVTGSVNSVASMGVAGGMTTGEADLETSSDPNFLRLQLQEAREEKEKTSVKYDQLMRKAEQFQKQLYRAEEDRRQALATSEALTSLWQKKFDKAQNENYDLRQELLTAHDRISLLQDHLAITRIHSRGTTPLRPSPPDSFHTSDHTHGHSYIPTVTSEVNHGRFSPVKPLTSGGGSTSLSGSSSSNGSNWLSRQSSSSSALSEGLKTREEVESPRAAEGGVARANVTPHRTSSFHGFNMIDPHYSASKTSSHNSSHNSSHPRSNSRTTSHSISRTVSLKSPHELTSPNGQTHKTKLHPHTSSEGDKRKTSDLDGSWI